MFSVYFVIVIVLFCKSQSIIASIANFMNATKQNLDLYIDEIIKGLELLKIMLFRCLHTAQWKIEIYKQVLAKYDFRVVNDTSDII